MLPGEYLPSLHYCSDYFLLFFKKQQGRNNIITLNVIKLGDRARANQLLLFSHQVMSESLWPRRLKHARFLCLPLSPGVCSNSCPLIRWCYLTISSSAAASSFCLQSFLASGSFPISWLFVSNGQNIRASTSALVLPMNIQDWFPLGLTGLISLESKLLSRVFPSTTIQKHQFFGAQPYVPTLTSIHDYWKNHSFDFIDLCWHSDVSAF